MNSQPVTPSQPHDAGLSPCWAVSVEVNGREILSLGHNWQAGDSRPNPAEILRAAEHLLAFIGAARSSPATTAPDGWKSAAFALAECVLPKGDYNWTPREWQLEMLAGIEAIRAAATPAHDGRGTENVAESDK